MQTAERTKELAANTLGELQHQGQKLDMIDRDLHDVRASLQSMTELATKQPSNLAGLLRSCCRQCAMSVGHVGHIRQCSARTSCKWSVLFAD